MANLHNQSHNRLNLTGQKYNHWLVIDSAGVINNVSYWNCVCVCGTKKVLSLGNLRSGKSQSCGCAKFNKKRPSIGQKFGEWTIAGEPIPYTYKYGTLIKYPCKCSCGTQKHISWYTIKNGLSKSCGCLRSKDSYSNSSEFKIWQNIIYRCHNQKAKAYKNYGGRGISVCDEWKYSFKKFLSCMGFRPTSRHSIDRINNNGNYEPKNCRWATYKEQMNNTRNNTSIRVGEETLTITLIAERIGVPRGTVYSWYTRKVLNDKLKEYLHLFSH